MNKIWLVCVIISAILIIFISPSLTLSSMINACQNSFGLCFDLLVIYSVWLGLLQIAEDSGLSDKLAKKLSPFTTRLFGKLDPDTNKVICLSISTNILGMGGVATPMGIEAMKRLQDGSDKATPNMKLFFVLCATSLQVLPTTVIGLRIANGSSSPGDIFLPTLITTLATTIIGVAVSILINKVKKKWATI